MTTIKRFNTGTKSFIKGYYTIENQAPNQFWSFVYGKSQIKEVSNCGLMLEYFDKLPEGAKII